MRKLFIIALTLLLLSITCSSWDGAGEFSDYYIQNAQHHINGSVTDIIPFYISITGGSISLDTTQLQSLGVSITNWPDKFNVVVDWDI